MIEVTTRIQVGSVVTVRETGWHETETYKIVLPHEANPSSGKVSNISPFGQALINQTPGQVVSVQAPTGAIDFEILQFK